MRITNESENGLLVCPEGAQINRQNPGLLCKLTRDAFLYSAKPQESEKDPPVKLSKGTQVIAFLASETNEKLAGEQDFVEVQTFTKTPKKRSGMLETGREITLGARGYVAKNNLALIDKVEWAKTPLFRGKDALPRPEDIQQSTLGDCFLLACLISMLNQEYGRNFIANMMRLIPKADGKNAVQLRLFDLESGKPIYIEFDAKYYNRHEILHQAAWVPFLEVGFTLPDRASLLAQYANGGQAKVAAKRLTGCDAQTVELALTPMSSFPITGFLISAVKSISEKFRGDESEIITLLKQSYVENLKPWPQFFDTDRNVILLYHFICKIHPDINSALSRNDQKYKEFLDIISEAEYDGALTLSNAHLAVSKIYNLYNSSEPGMDLFPGELLRNFQEQELQEKSKLENLYYHPYRSASGFGDYSKREIEIFLGLRSQLNTHIITATTLKDLDKEICPQGLKPFHIYAVTGASTETINGVNIHFVHLHNPWGNTGVFYDWPKDFSGPKSASQITKESSSGVFKLELRHFTEFMKEYNYTHASHLVHGLKSDIDVSQHLEVEKQEAVQDDLGLILKNKNFDDFKKMEIILDLLYRKIKECEINKPLYGDKENDPFQKLIYDLRTIIDKRKLQKKSEVEFAIRIVEDISKRLPTVVRNSVIPVSMCNQAKTQMAKCLEKCKLGSSDSLDELSSDTSASEASDSFSQEQERSSSPESDLNIENSNNIKKDPLLGKKGIEGCIEEIKNAQFSKAKKSFLLGLAVQVKRIEKTTYGEASQKENKIVALFGLIQEFFLAPNKDERLIIQAWKEADSLDAKKSNYNLISTQRRTTGLFSLFNPKKAKSQDYIDSYLESAERSVKSIQ